MDKAEINKLAYKLYWAHSRDVSNLSEADGRQVLENLEHITRREDRANEIVDEIFTGERTHYYGIIGG